MKNIKSDIISIIERDGFATCNESELYRKYEIKQIFKAVNELIDLNIVKIKNCDGFAIELVK